MVRDARLLYSPEFRKDAENAVSLIGGTRLALLDSYGLWVVSKERLLELLKAEQAHNEARATVLEAVTS